MAKIVESQFKDLILESNTNLVEDRIIIKKNSKKVKYIRFMNGCGVENFDQFLSILDATQLERTPTDEYTRAPRFFGKGFNLRFKDHDIGVLFSKRGAGHIEQKKLSPMTLGLNGYRTKDSNEFKQKIID